MDENKKKKFGCIFAAVSFGILFLVLAITCGGPDDPEALKAQRESDRKFTAEVLARQFVEQRLKSPASADFGLEPKTKKTSDSTYVIMNFVDSENEFGAKMRNHFMCTVLLKTDSTGVCYDMVIN